jgi:hypothetical protein
MKRILTILFLFIGITLNAQQFCTKVIPVKEILSTTVEKVKIKEAVTRWELVSPATEALYEVTQKIIVLCEGYEKVIKKFNGSCDEWCTIWVEPVTKTVVEQTLSQAAQPPVYKLVVVSPALYETYTITQKVKDGKIVVTTALCD